MPDIETKDIYSEDKPCKGFETSEDHQLKRG